MAIRRRDFLTATAGAAAAGMTEPAFGEGRRPSWDEEADVVIVGSGLAALSAAIEALDAGRSVLILDKMEVPGGNSIINGGWMAAAGTAIQERAGIEDAPERMLQDMLAAGNRLNHKPLARKVATKSVEALNWVKNVVGVSFVDEVTRLGGHSVARSHRSAEQSGFGYVQPMLMRVQELGSNVRLRHKLTGLIRNESGRIEGVRVRAGYEFGQENSGTPWTVRAKGAVILASGGFAADIAYRTVQDPQLTDALSDTNQRGATAEALIMAYRSGAVPLQQSWIQLGPWTSPDEKGIGEGYVFNIQGAFPYGILVDPETGERIVNELANRKVRADALLAAGHPCISICDADAARNVPALDILLDKGVVQRFDSLTALAEHYSIPLSELKKTVDRYNRFVRKGRDDRFGKPILDGATPINKAPFYAMRTWPKVHHTMGGVQIDVDARVIGADGEPVPGFLAAGEVTGGVHGAVRLGSCAITDCIVFGRTAGRSAVKAARER